MRISIFEKVCFKISALLNRVFFCVFFVFFVLSKNRNIIFGVGFFRQYTFFFIELIFWFFYS